MEIEVKKVPEYLKKLSFCILYLRFFFSHNHSTALHNETQLLSPPSSSPSSLPFIVVLRLTKRVYFFCVYRFFLWFSFSLAAFLLCFPIHLFHFFYTSCFLTETDEYNLRDLTIIIKFCVRLHNIYIIDLQVDRWADGCLENLFLSYNNWKVGSGRDQTH